MVVTWGIWQGHCQVGSAAGRPRTDAWRPVTATAPVSAPAGGRSAPVARTRAARLWIPAAVTVAVAGGWAVRLLALPTPVLQASSATAHIAAGLPGGPAPGGVGSSRALAAVEETNAGRQVLAGTPAPPGWRTAAVIAAAQTSGLPTALVAAVIQVESAGDPLAVSPAGAEGLMQLEPVTAAALGVHNIFDPRQNAIGGARYLATWLRVYGGPNCVSHPTTCPDALSLALAAYNAGPGAVQRYGGIPPYPLVHLYVSEVEAIYQSYRAAP